MQKENLGNKKAKLRIVGTRPARADAMEKVKGTAVYGADIALPDMLYGAVLRSPLAHARLRSIDTQAAEAFPGVRAVITSEELPQTEMGQGKDGLFYARANILAIKKVLYDGHPIAAVAADSLETAQAALDLIQVDYEPLPPVMDGLHAMLLEAPVLIESLRTVDLGQRADIPSNIARHFRYQIGDLQQALDQAEVVLEGEYSTAAVHQGYIEPQNATAIFDASGKLTVWCSTQGAFDVRSQLADILEIPLEDIRVIPTEVGGAFGGKNIVYLEPVAALLSKKSGGRVVKMAMSYREVLAATGPTSGSFIKLKLGANREGKITAAQAQLVYEAGAFPGSPVDSGAGVIFSPYNIPNIQIDGYDVLVNRPRTSTYRAPGSSNAVFACETMIDELATQLHMDPLELRIKNAASEGDLLVDKSHHGPIDILQTLETARSLPHLSAPLQKSQCTYIKYGRGIACGYWGNYSGCSSASARIETDGTVSLAEGSIDLSGTRTTLSMQLAESLGIPLEKIHARVADTSEVGFTEGSYGSRTTFSQGWVGYELGCRLKNKMAERAACLWEVPLERVKTVNGKFSAGKNAISFQDLASLQDQTSGPIEISLTMTPDGVGAAFGVHIADVEVDLDTGQVHLLRYTALQDVGRAVHPGLVEGQIQGGVAQGIGWGLMEGYIYSEEGVLLNDSLSTYLLPTVMDLPLIDPVLVENGNPGHPYGVRGVGEIPIVPPPAAVANAIYSATGIRMKILPMTMERLWKEIRSV